MQIFSFWNTKDSELVVCACACMSMYDMSICLSDLCRSPARSGRPVALLYPLDDSQIGGIPPIEFLFFVHARRSVETHTLTYPRPMVSHMDPYYVPQRLVRCILAVFVVLDVTPQWTQMANASGPPIGIACFCLVFCNLIYHHPAQTNRHMGTLWGILHHPNQKTGRAWRFSWFY